jgi:deoxycytidylate deaminase
VRKPKDPKDLAIALLRRSECSVQVAAVLADLWGIFSWGWNSTGMDGFGEHAESHCLRRSNGRRLKGATLYIAAVRKKNGRVVTAKPCEACQGVIKKVGRVCYRNGEGVWMTMTI